MQILSDRIYFIAAIALSCAATFVPGIAQAQPDIKDVFQNALACAVVDPLLADMPVEPLYTMEGNTCVSLEPDDDESRRYFNDMACTSPVNFAYTSLSSHCSLLLDSTLLGEGNGIVDNAWTLTPGTRLDLGARSLEGVSQPYMQRHVYRTIETPRGTCNLEMRVYSSTPDSTVQANTRQSSLLAFHGGSWSARGFGFFGLELSVPHYTDKGFVVYAPFYRLLETSDGSAACNDASIGDVVEDAQAALQWVRDRAESFGSSPKPVVFGQSAGAHLALSLAVNTPSNLAGGILFYPPTDFTDFTLRAQQGLYDNPQGLGILDSVIGVSASEADLSASPIPDNSFPIRIVESGLSIPPLMIVHGMADDLVEARQSVRLCDALAGRQLLALDAEIDPLDNLRRTITCGAGSQLQLIDEGQHALDVCLKDVLIPTDLCPSGSSSSRQEVSLAIAEAVDFALLASAGEQPSIRVGGSGSGALSPVVLWSLLILTIQAISRKSVGTDIVVFNNS